MEFTYTARRVDGGESRVPCVFFVCCSRLTILSGEGNYHMRHIATFATTDFGKAAMIDILCHTLEWEAHNHVAMYCVDSKTAILQLVKEPDDGICDLCRQGSGILIIKGRKICRTCSDRIIEMSRIVQ